MRKIAVTGGLASGKTSVCRFLRKLGAYVVSADEIVHKLLTLDSETGSSIVKLFGPEVVIDGQLDRALIAEIAFQSRETLEKLEQIIHPQVGREIDRLYREVSEEQRYSLFVVEVPLLFEAGMEDLFDAVIAVRADPEICRERFGDEEQYTKRMQRQVSMEEKERRADFVLFNEGSLEELRAATEAIIESLSIQ